MAVVNCPGPVHSRFFFSSFIFCSEPEIFLRKTKRNDRIKKNFFPKKDRLQNRIKNKILFKSNDSRLLTPSLRGSKTSVDYGTTLMDQYCRLNTVIWLGFVQFESCVSQALSGNVKIFTRKSRTHADRMTAGPICLEPGIYQYTYFWNKGDPAHADPLFQSIG